MRNFAISRTRTIRLRGLWVFVWVLGVGPALGLEWSATTLSFKTTPFQSTQEAVFEFRNTGDKTVKLTDLQTNCDCLDATTEETTFPPGASGRIKAVFKIGERPGLTERVVTVLTDETATPVRLLVQIEVPEIATITPRTVNWKIGSTEGEQFVEISPVAGVNLDFASAKSTNDAFIVRLEKISQARYRIHVRPVDTARPASAAIRIFGRSENGRDVILSAYANVQ